MSEDSQFRKNLTLAQAILGLLLSLIPVSAAIYRQTLMLEKHDWWIQQHQQFTTDRNSKLDVLIERLGDVTEKLSNRQERMDSKLDVLMTRVK